MTVSLGPQDRSQDPYVVLGVLPSADAEELRAAYLRKVREFPPDRAPERFEQVRDAYDRIRSPQQRARRWLEAPGCGRFVDLLDELPARRLHVGPDAWLEVVRGR